MNVEKIKCIFFSEFHHVTGPKITYQVPDGYISRDFFDDIHTYIITKPELQKRLITVNTQGHKIIGCPVFLSDKKYVRNALIFNCCFVLSTETRTMQLEPVVKKLSEYLAQLEVESSLLSDENKKKNIPLYLAEILKSLNQFDSCSLNINEFCTIYLKIPPMIEDPPPVQDFDVPVFINDRPQPPYTMWDLTTQQVLHYIDGFNHVAKIAAEADIEINLVKACLQNLLYVDLITIISIFQYSNMYTVTDSIRNVAEDLVLQEECLNSVAAKGRVKPNFRDVFMLYSSLTPGLTVKDLCMRYNPHSMKIDEKKLIQFGMKKKIIRRLHGYPLKLPGQIKLMSRLQAWQSFFNGTHCLDEICVKAGYSYKEIEEMIENDPNIVICWK